MKVKDVINLLNQVDPEMDFYISYFDDYSNENDGWVTEPINGISIRPGENNVTVY